MRRLTLLTLCLLCLSACDTAKDLIDWADEEDAPLEGERIAVMGEQTLKPDAEFAAKPMRLPSPEMNESWPQAGGNPQNQQQHLALSGTLQNQDSTKAGEGNGWEGILLTSPVVAGKIIFSMDALGYVVARNTEDLGQVIWSSSAAVEQDEPDLLGGGLAYDNGRLYINSGYGKIIALEAATGKELWRRALGVPIRSSPRVAGDKLLVLTVDSQLIALDAAIGTPLWSHRGINETAGFIVDLAPAVDRGIVIVPYASGQIFALDLATGQERWSDSLALSRRTYASDVFSGIGGDPVTAYGAVFAASNSGLLAATELASGRRLWEQDIPALNSPWISGEYMFLLSSQSTLYCLSARDGRIKWNAQLPRFKDEDKKRNPLTWRGPVFAGGKLWIVGAHGVMLGIDPATGMEEITLDIPDEVYLPPIVANGKMYLVDKSANLYVLQ